jgi:hypothetical protein
MAPVNTPAAPPERRVGIRCTAEADHNDADVDRLLIENTNMTKPSMP